jgi:hypothetical protein
MPTKISFIASTYIAYTTFEHTTKVIEPNQKLELVEAHEKYSLYKTSTDKNLVKLNTFKIKKLNKI